MQASDSPLVVIVAPPGYGKTTLCAEWSQADNRAFVWAPSGVAGRELMQLVRATRARHSQFVVVVDDLDHLHAKAAAESVSSALNDLPVGSTIALTSRTEPQLPLGRLRAHRLVTEVRIADLAMGADEVDALLRHEGIELPPEEVHALLERTEGWPAATYLAAIGLRDSPGGTPTLSGSQRTLYEYVRDEVLAPLPEELRRFAARTSILDELSAPLCDAMLARSGSAPLLRELACRTSLLVCSGGSHVSYRWHGIVREALRLELEQVEPEVEPTLQRRASLWYAHRGSATAAIDHAVSAGDGALASALLGDHLMSYLLSGRTQLVRRWLAELGTEQVSGYGPLAVAAALTSLLTGNAMESQRWTLIATAASEREHDGHVSGPVAAGAATAQAMAGGVGVAATGELAARTAKSQPPDSQWRPICLFVQAVALHLLGDHAAACPKLDEAIGAAGAAAPTLTSLCLAQQAMIAMEEKDWELAAELTDRADMVIGEWRLADEPISALAFAASAAARAHQGRVDEAKSELRRGIDLLSLGDFAPWYGAEARIMLAHASLWLADVVGARALLADASRLGRKLPEAVAFRQWFEDAWAYMDTLAETRMAGPSSLTIAELRILRFLPSHRSFREIGNQLGVSANTVKTQAHAVYRKLGAASRSEAVARAVDAGLLG